MTNALVPAWFNIGAQQPYGREAMQSFQGYPQEIQANIRGAPGFAIGLAAPGFQIGAGCPSCGYGVSGAGDPNVTLAMPNTYRKFPIGLDSVVDVAGSAVFTVQTQIQVPFRGKRLVLNPQNAVAWFVQQIFIGVQLQQPALVNMPGAAFLPESLVPLELDTAQVGNLINIVVQNRSPGGQRFQGGMIGDVVKA